MGCSVNGNALEIRGLTKTFGSLVANNAIDLEIRKAEIHAILGENGAGKSTLMKCVFGILSPDSGSILVNGNEVRITDPNKAIELGLGMVHQHFMLIRPFTVAQNMILGSETTFKGPGGFLNMKEARARTAEIAKAYGLAVDPDAKIEDISVGEEQRVEILKALYRGAEILILDEPTAVLTPQETDELFAILRSLREQGKTIIIITHKLREIREIADRCTIIRTGRKIETVGVADKSEADLARLMVGRDVQLTFDRPPRSSDKVLLKVSDLKVRNNRGLMAVDGLSFDVREGEILGIAGVEGNGQAELCEVLMGIRRVEEGSVELVGKDLTRATPREIIDAGMTSIPQDRQRLGLVLDFSVKENSVLQSYGSPRFRSRAGFIRRDAVESFSKELVEAYDVRPRDVELTAASLSGGNQQKLIIARQISQDPSVLVVNQPTRGLDVGAIQYVHKALLAQRNAGRGILLVSLELDEIFALSDRILVFYNGKIAGEVSPSETSQREIGLLMTRGGSDT